MDLNTFRDISYGMYIISTKYQQRNVGCFINTLVQITSENPIISISVNKQNYTNEAIRKVKKFAISILSEQTKADVIGKFGFFSSKNTDKFDNVKYENIDEMPIVKENMCGYLICELLNIVDCNTHDIIIAKVIDAQKENNYKPMTYGYYHEVIKGTAPKTAPTYIKKTKEKEVKSMNKYECIACGYVYDEEVEGTKWEDLPEDWKCPLCGVGKDMFKKIEE